MHSSVTQRCLGVLASVLIISVAGCRVSPGARGGVAVSFTIGGKTITVTFGDAGVFPVQPGTSRRNETNALQPFEQAPTDRPSSATASLRRTSVTVTEPGPGKSGVTQQGINGTATLSVIIAEGSSTAPCETGIEIGTFTITVDDGEVTGISGDIILNSEALSLLLTNNISLCLEMEATFEATVEIAGLDIVFGPSEEGGEENDNGFEPGPADNENSGEPPEACASDSDCGADETCVYGMCTPAPTACTDATDCPDGEVCTEGECAPEVVTGLTLTIVIDGMGSVDPPGGTYDPGTSVTLTATAAEGWRFDRWEGDVTGSDNPVTVTLDADSTITAVFLEEVMSNITFRATYDRLWDTDEQNPGYTILHSAMSGDGNRLVWAIEDNDTGGLSILTMNVDGSDQTIIPAPAEVDSVWEVTINYDGSRAFFRRWSNLLFKVEGGVIAQILDVADVDGLGSIGLIQSTATGDYVYFLDDEPNDNDVWRVSHSGGTPELVVNDGDVILHNGFPAAQVADFSISDDGGSLVFTIYAYWGDSGYTSRSEMFIQTGGAYTQLTTDGDEYSKSNPCISGDGSTIVFSRNYRWYSMNADGTNEIDLGPAGYNLGGPVLIPDGSKMFYSDSESGGTVILNTDGSGRQNIVPEWNITNIAIGATRDHAISDDATRVSFYTEYGVMPENAAFYVGYLEEPDSMASSVADAPFIDSITFSPESFPRNDPEATLLLLASIDDPDGLADVTNAAVDAMIDGIHLGYDDVPAYFYFSPRDDGESPDVTAADGVFTSKASAGNMLDTLDEVTIRVSAMDASKTITVADTVLTITGPD